MRTGARVGWRAGATLVSALLLGCASGPRGEKTVLASASGDSVVLLPLNVTAVMPPELEPHSDRVWRQLKPYLEAQGVRLKTVAFPVARRMWLASLRQARAASGDERVGLATARIFTAELSKHAEFQAVILPSLFVQKADITGKTAKWDGVVREVEVEARGPGAVEPEDPPIYGAAPAASLHAIVLDAEGEKLQESLGGLELLVRVRLSTDPGDGQPKFVRRSELFGGREAVLEGIAIALAPYLPQLTPSELETRLEGRRRLEAP